MQFIFDNLVALLIGTVVLLILLGLMTDWSTESMDRTRQHMTRESQRALAEMFERDILNVGANVPVGSPMILENSTGNFSFYSAVNGTGVAKQIDYKLIPVSQPDGSTLYQIERWVDGAYSGGSSVYFRWFEVKLLDASNNAVTTAPYTDARKVVVRFQSVLPYTSSIETERASLRHLNWESVYQPTLLAR